MVVKLPLPLLFRTFFVYSLGSTSKLGEEFKRTTALAMLVYIFIWVAVP